MAMTLEDEIRERRSRSAGMKRIRQLLADGGAANWSRPVTEIIHYIDPTDALIIGGRFKTMCGDGGVGSGRTLLKDVTCPQCLQAFIRLMDERAPKPDAPQVEAAVRDIVRQGGQIMMQFEAMDAEVTFRRWTLARLIQAALDADRVKNNHRASFYEPEYSRDPER